MQNRIFISLGDLTLQHLIGSKDNITLHFFSNTCDWLVAIARKIVRELLKPESGGRNLFPQTEEEP
jgi:hypothetical protein